MSSTSSSAEKGGGTSGGATSGTNGGKTAGGKTGGVTSGSGGGTAEADSASLGGCDVAKGRWVPSHEPPPYTGFTCTTLRAYENCQKNKRPDSAYLNWQWQPDDCDLRRFDPAAFASRFRNKVLGISGDSFSSNFGSSIRCIIASFTTTKDFTSTWYGQDVRGYKVPAYNITFLSLSAVFLVDATPMGAAKSSGTWKIHLDKPKEVWAAVLRFLDVFIFTTGHWFVNAPPKLRQFYMKGVLQNDMSPFEAMRVALSTVRDSIINSDYRGVPVMLSYSPYHYEEAYGGDPKKCCKGAQRPFTDAEVAIAERGTEALDAVATQLGVFQQVTKPPVKADERATFRIMDVTRLSLMRPDAHLQNYTGASGTDCSHWCNPGLPDTWSDILYNVLMPA
ncbi:unnamed protein product [Closterium sp. Yama58-4]|nr:unnamed protein product [Closterium sp. Yama58-4]